MRSLAKHDIQSGDGQPLSLVLAKICQHAKRFLIVSSN